MFYRCVFSKCEVAGISSSAKVLLLRQRLFASATRRSLFESSRLLTNVRLPANIFSALWTTGTHCDRWRRSRACSQRPGGSWKRRRGCYREERERRRQRRTSSSSVERYDNIHRIIRAWFRTKVVGAFDVGWSGPVFPSQWHHGLP